MRTPNPGRFSFILGVSALAFGLAACSDDISDSGPLSTDRMYPDFTAVADGKGGTKLQARITKGGYKSTAFLTWSDNAFNATVGTEQKQLPPGAEGRFSADFTEPSGDRKLSISHDLGEAGKAPLVSTGTLPEGFTAALVSTGTLPRDQKIDFTWSPIEPEGRMDWSISGKCITSASGKNIGSKGTFTITADKYTQKKNKDDKTPDNKEECPVTLTVDRVLYGVVDEAYNFGDFLGIQRRTITFTSGAPVPPASP